MKTKKAFTLVELIIVIAILSILGVLAVLGFKNYISNSRDSVRMTDISTIFSGLSMFHSKNGLYPFPDDYITILNGSGILTHQGTVGNEVKNIIRLSGKGTDPKREGLSYICATNASRTKAQVLGYLEDGENYGIAYQPIPVTLAQEVGSELKDSYVYLFGDTLGLITDNVKNSIDQVIDEKEVDICKLPAGSQVYFGGETFGIGKVQGVCTDLLVAIESVENDTVPCNSETYSGYTISALSHNETKSFQKNISILHSSGAISTLTIQCINGALDYLHATETVSFVCDSGYARSGNICVQDLCVGNPPTHALLKGTQQYGTSWVYSQEVGICHFVCDTNYSYDSGTNTCSADTRTQNACNGSIASFSQDNSTTTSRTQTWQGTDWNPIYSYHQSLTSDLCTFTCQTGYTWNATTSQCDRNTYTITGSFGASAGNASISVCGNVISADASGNFSTSAYYGTNCSNTTASKSNYSCTTSINGPASLTTNISNIAGSCSVNSQTATCGGSIPANATASMATTYTQTWDGSAWTPTTSWGASQATCDFNCNANYTRNAGACVADSQSATCGGSIPTNATASTATTYTQTWDGSAWTPTTSWGASQATCDFNCNANYTRNGASCAGNSCGATTISSYSVIALSHGGTTTSTKNVAITNGSRTYSQGFACNLGTTSTSGAETNTANTCNAGYTWNGSSCAGNSCGATTISGYSVGALSHGGNTTSTKNVDITNGTRTYSQGFACNLGTTSTSGAETNTANTCSAGYTWNGSSCAGNSCGATTISGYSVIALSHGGTTTSSKNVAITNGTRTYSQGFTCSLGTTSTSGVETNTANTCNAGYGWNGSSCANKCVVIGGFTTYNPNLLTSADGWTYTATSRDPQKSWADAQTFCAGLKLCGYTSGWKAPSRTQLKTLYDNKSNLSGLLPYNIVYWTSVKYATYYARGATMESRYEDNIWNNESFNGIRCVH